MSRSMEGGIWNKSFAVLVLLSLVGCRQPPSVVPSIQMLSGRTMGTTYSVKIAPKGNIPSLRRISDEVQSELQNVNMQMSTYLPTSEISQFNSSDSTDWIPVSPETAIVVQMANEISIATEGAFDATVGPLVNLWGFGPAGSNDEPPTKEQVSAIRDHVGYANLDVRLRPPALRKKKPEVQVDLSAIAKGHGVDRIAETLLRLGVTNFFVEIGGEVRTSGSKLDGQPWRVGIEDPATETAADEPRRVHQVLALSDLSLATSGNYRNYFEANGRRFAHTIDPRTGFPAEVEIASASVVNASCAMADGIATAMMCVGYQEGIQIAEAHDWAVLLLFQQDGQLKSVQSTRFVEFFPGDQKE